MGVNWGGAGTGAASGAATGTAVNPGWGTAIGGVIGGIAGLFSPKDKGAAVPATGAASTAKPAGGFTDAFTSGLGSLFGQGGGGGFSPFLGGATPINVTQTQDVNQTTNLNVQNVIGSNPFGGFDPESGLDPFQTIADVFAIKNAQGGGGTTILSSGTPSTQKSFNILPIILIGGGIAAFLLLKGKK